MPNPNFELLADYGYLNGGSRRFCYGAWHDNSPKWDIREWRDEEPKRGVTLTEGECIALRDLLNKVFPADGGETQWEPSAEYEEAVNLTEADFVVRRNSFYCNKNHEVNEVSATVTITDWDSNEKETTITAGYCESCEVYFILERDYQRLKSMGWLHCEIYTEAQYNSSSDSFRYDNLNKESKLRVCGYSAAEGNLTTLQRQDVLTFILDNGILDKHQILSHLDWLIRERRGNPAQVRAVQKWEMDRDYVSSYRIGSRRKVSIRSIVERG